MGVIVFDLIYLSYDLYDINSRLILDTFQEQIQNNGDLEAQLF